MNLGTISFLFLHLGLLFFSLLSDLGRRKKRESRKSSSVWQDGERRKSPIFREKTGNCVDFSHARTRTHAHFQKRLFARAHHFPVI